VGMMKTRVARDPPRHSQITVHHGSAPTDWRTPIVGGRSTIDLALALQFAAVGPTSLNKPQIHNTVAYVCMYDCTYVSK